MKHVITIWAVLVSCAWTYAIEGTSAAPVGTVPLKKGHFGTGLEYVFAEDDVKTEEAFFGGVRLPADKIKKVQLDRIVFVPSYALLDNIILLGRFGGSRMDIDENANKGTLAGQQGTSDWGFTAGGGVRAVIYKKERFTWAISGLITWCELDGFDPWSGVFNGIPISDGKMKINLTDYQFSTGPAYEFVDGWILSAGPYARFINADAKVSAPVFGETVKTNINIKEQDYLGGYISSQLMITDTLGWNVRFAATASSYLIGTNVSRAF